METYQAHSALGTAMLIEKPYSDYAPVAGPNQLEKCQMAMNKLFVPDLNTKGVPAFKGISEAYVHLTGDSTMNRRFNIDRISMDLRACQDFNTGSFVKTLQNAMNIFISKAYREALYHEEIFISQKNNVQNFRKIKSVQLGYFGELPDVDAESADYADMEPLSESEASYDLSQKGAVIWVTEQVIINDDINFIREMIKRQARSARLAHAKYVWRFFINNALCPDGTPWFTAGHGNLANDALDISPLVIAIKALANMTEPGPSIEKLGIDLATLNWKLIVPINIWDTAVEKNQCDAIYTANDLTTKKPNPCKKLFGERNERIITCPFITAANDWGIVRDCEEIPILEMSYLNGQEEPELVAQWSPNERTLITMNGDKIGYKVRHEYGGALVDPRGGYKSIVP